MFRPSVGHRQVVYIEEYTQYNMHICILYWVSSSVYTTWWWPTEGRNMLL